MGWSSASKELFAKKKLKPGLDLRLDSNQRVAMVLANAGCGKTLIGKATAHNLRSRSPSTWPLVNTRDEPHANNVQFTDTQSHRFFEIQGLDETSG